MIDPIKAMSKQCKFHSLCFRRMLGRRHFMCRLPLLAIWTLILILIIYKIVGDINEAYIEHSSKVQETSNYALETGRGRVVSAGFDRLMTSEPNINRQKVSNVFAPSAIDSHRVGRHQDGAARSMLSAEKSVPQFTRKSKVYVLIVQSDNIVPGVLSRRQSSRPLLLGASKSLSSSDKPRINIPPHIVALISTLKAHRIDYTLGTTQTGLPNSLLADQDKNSENKQYSVIIIDDFIKYTKLNRWARDQLDRHCRANQIGVITYLTSSKSHIKDAQSNRFKKSSKVDQIYAKPDIGKVVSEESLADQFPLSFKTVDRSLCDSNATLPTCSIDYHLNERSPMLRILKRRAQFILRWPISQDTDQYPWISIYSNHVTYEPLTWIKFRQNLAAQSGIGEGVSKVFRNQVREGSNGAYSNLQPDQDGLANGKVDKNLLAAQPKQPPLSRENSSSSSNDLYLDYFDKDFVLSMFDQGLYDGVKRVIFGDANLHWLNRILMLDAIEHLSYGAILTPLERYIQIDIDDVFVGEQGKRMNANNVNTLVETQAILGNYIEGGFKFNLGYSGKYYKHGRESENAGDELLILKSNNFTWFCHTWSHSKAHLLNDTRIIADELRKNFEFAQKHRLPIIGHGGPASNASESLRMPPTYAVAPHHSGVYPVHEQLYDAWTSVLNVQATSTEEYPRLRPASGRRAFVHKTIKVLPRQTCGLYTHTVYRDKYPGGIEKLDSSILGGELFETILHNPVNIYMTHMSNYANDLLAPYTFTALLQFVEANTNLRLKYAPSGPNQLGPTKLADYYFSLYPDEREPIWTNPCKEKRHLTILAPEKLKYCSIEPKLIIVGPQKTGTTALYFYLKMNPQFKSSQTSQVDFEEIQFFNDKHYFNGVDWYFSRFPFDENQVKGINDGDSTNSDGPIFYFDKSATYFDDPKVPKRANNLMPEARIVILLVDPADRAYSWYQHIKAHGDKTANSLTFEQIIASSDDDPKTDRAVRALRNRCLHPGYYAKHLSAWLEFYPPRQIIIIDGQWFKYNPASVMNRLQLILRVDKPLDYHKLLVYDERKGFFCERGELNQGPKCLGSSKGRRYPPMSREARKFLNQHYWPHNWQLARILSDIGQPLPSWMDTNYVNSVIY